MQYTEDGMSQYKAYDNGVLLKVGCSSDDEAAFVSLAELEEMVAAVKALTSKKELD